MEENITSNASDLSLADNSSSTDNTSEISFEQILSKFSEEGKNTLTKNGVNNFESLEKSYKGLLELKGKKGIIEPSESASEEEKQAFRETLLDKLGRPQDANYDFKVKQEIADEYITNEFSDGLAELAYKNGMSNESFSELMDYIYDNYASVVNKFEEFKTAVQFKLGEGNLDDKTNLSLPTSADYEKLSIEANEKMLEASKKGDYINRDKYYKEGLEYLRKSRGLQ